MRASRPRAARAAEAALVVLVCLAFGAGLLVVASIGACP